MTDLVRRWACEDPRGFVVPSGPDAATLRTVLYKAYNSLPRYCPLESYFALADALYPHLTMSWERQWLSSEVMLKVRMVPARFAWRSGGLVSFRMMARNILKRRMAGDIPDEAMMERFIRFQNRLGLDTPFPDTVPWKVVALLPLSGRYAPLGRQVLFGLLAAGFQGFALTVVDTHSSPAEALRQAVRLVLSESPVAVIGPPDRASIRLLAMQVWTRPIIFPTSPVQGIPADTGALFFSRPSARRRLQALVFRAEKMGARNFCTIAPDTGYGRKMASVFASILEHGSHRVLDEQFYSRSGMPVKFRVPARCDAVLVPESGHRLGLVARRIAAGGRFPGPLTVSDVRGRRRRTQRGLIIMSTAEGIVPDDVRKSHRYLQGALLVPGFYAEPAVLSPRERNFLKVLASHGITRVIAPAYEAFMTYTMLHTLVSSNHETGQELLQGLQSVSPAPGEPPMFDSRGHALRSIVVYRVRGRSVEVTGH